MKTMKRTLFAFCILRYTCMAEPHVHVLHEWRADLRDVSRIERIDIRSGDAGVLRVQLVDNRVSYTPTTVAAYYQTNGMAADAWWQAPARIVEGGVEVDWVGELEPNAPAASLMFRVDGNLYRAPALMRFLPSPGRAPNALPMPVEVLDFATVSVANAPWTLPDEVSAAIAATLEADDVATRADVQSLTNTVSDLVASAVSASPTGADMAVVKLALADLWARVEGIEGLDGYDDVRDAIDAIVGGAMTNYVHRTDLGGYVPRTRSVNGHALQADIVLSAADVDAIPASGVATAPYPAQLGTDPDVYIYFEPTVHNLYYSGSGGLSVLGCYVPPGPARHLVLVGFADISWPLDLHIIDGRYELGAENYYEVGNANGQNYIRFLFAY